MPGSAQGVHPTAPSYQALLAQLSAPLRERALSLPYKLGLSSDPAAGWEAFTVQPLMYDMPRFVLDIIGDGVAPEILQRFCYAHHCAGFFGLLYDRLADGHISDAAEVSCLLPVFSRTWQEALTQATGDPAGSAVIVALATQRLVYGTARQSEALRARAISGATYAASVADKVYWLAATTVMLLERFGTSADVAGFLECFYLTLLGMQCLDDALDADEDTRLFGASYSDALGYSAGSLYCAGLLVLNEALKKLNSLELNDWIQWLITYKKALSSSRIIGEPWLDAFGGVALATELRAGTLLLHHGSR
ncbi:MAG: hypothetical protein QNJ97_22665 [Myxococcota bacterium]|nr:hypothetical protein [Myxococcota bacterium]